MLGRKFRDPRQAGALFLALAIAVTGAFATTGSAAAAAPKAIVPIPVASGTVPENGVQLTAAQPAQIKAAMARLSRNGLWNEFTGVNGALALKDPLSVVQTKYQLSASDVQMIQTILATDKQRAAAVAAAAAAASTAPKTGIVHPDLSTSGLVIYFTFSDVGVFLIGAAMAGPWVLLSALDLVASIVAPVYGTVLGGILGLIGIATIGQIGNKIMQGYFHHEGVYFGFSWNWPWPIPSFVLDNWCGCN